MGKSQEPNGLALIACSANLAVGRTRYNETRWVGRPIWPKAKTTTALPDHKTAQSWMAQACRVNPP